MPATIHHEPTILPLRDGDQLKIDEYLRRYDAMPDLKHAELIEGVVSIMSSPVSAFRHGQLHAEIVGWLINYKAGTPGVLALNDTTLRLDERNCPQPDAMLIVHPDRNPRLTVERNILVGSPELVVEVSASTTTRDAQEKKEVYRRNGVQEYILWRVDDRHIDWFVLHDGQYQSQPIDEAGVLKSVVFPGLWLDPVALIAGDLAKVLQVLQTGLASLDHTAFKQRQSTAP